MQDRKHSTAGNNQGTGKLQRMPHSGQFIVPSVFKLHNYYYHHHDNPSLYLASVCLQSNGPASGVQHGGSSCRVGEGDSHWEGDPVEARSPTDTTAGKIYLVNGSLVLNVELLGMVRVWIIGDCTFVFSS